MTQIDQPFWNSSGSVQKAVDLTIPAKNRRNMAIIDLNFQIKKIMLIWHVGWFEIGLPNHLYTA